MDVTSVPQLRTLFMTGTDRGNISGPISAQNRLRLQFYRWYFSAVFLFSLRSDFLLFSIIENPLFHRHPAAGIAPKLYLCRSIFDKHCFWVVSAFDIPSMGKFTRTPISGIMFEMAWRRTRKDILKLDDWMFCFDLKSLLFCFIILNF